jgi:ubiquitin-like protein Pup
MATKDTGGQRQAPRRSEEEQESETQGGEAVKERQDKLTDDVDAILDEFVRSYVQKGGE